VMSSNNRRIDHLQRDIAGTASGECFQDDV
jgi:hypothetical protein